MKPPISCECGAAATPERESATGGAESWRVVCGFGCKGPRRSTARAAVEAWNGERESAEWAARAAGGWRRPSPIEGDAIERHGLNSYQCVIVGDGVHEVEGSPAAQSIAEEPVAKLSEIMPETS